MEDLEELKKRVCQLVDEFNASQTEEQKDAIRKRIEDLVERIFQAEDELQASMANKSAYTVENASKENKKLVFNLLILDESGSMNSMYHQAITGVNKTLETIRKAESDYPDQAHFVTLVTFNSRRYHSIYNVTPARDAKDMSPEQYRPGFCTPLFDAMGRAITYLETVVKDEDIALVTIITDGLENDSRKYTREAIKELVTRLRSEGWIFTYIGANQDVEEVAMSMSINNYREFESTPEGATDMFEREERCRNMCFYKVSRMSKEDLAKEDFFEDYEG